MRKIIQTKDKNKAVETRKGLRIRKELALPAETIEAYRLLAFNTKKTLKECMEDMLIEKAISKKGSGSKKESIHSKTA